MAAHRNRPGLQRILRCALFVLGAGTIAPSLAQAQPPAFETDYALPRIAHFAGIRDRYPKDLPTFIGQILGTVLALIGTLFFLSMLYAGVLWMTSRGNADQADRAKHLIMVSSIGLLIVLSSYVLLQTVFQSIGS